MTIQEIQEHIIEEFAVFEDWIDKYSYLIELGSSLETMSQEDRKSENIINGCQSRVWLNAKYEDGLLYFKGYSDAVIVKGIVALVLKVFSGQKPKDIMNASTDFISKIGLDEHLSPTRSNGLLAMIKQIKIYALALNKN